jgi:hypothetical protein
MRARRIPCYRTAKRPIVALIWNIAPFACASAGAFALILAAFHVCPFSIPVELFRYCAYSGATCHLLKGLRIF